MIFRKTFFFIFLLASFITFPQQWRYPTKNNLVNEVVVTYKVTYDRALTEKQKQSSRFKKQIVVAFNSDMLLEKNVYK